MAWGCFALCGTRGRIIFLIGLCCIDAVCTTMAYRANAGQQVLYLLALRLFGVQSILYIGKIAWKRVLAAPATSTDASTTIDVGTGTANGIANGTEGDSRREMRTPLVQAGAQLNAVELEGRGNGSSSGSGVPSMCPEVDPEASAEEVANRELAAKKLRAERMDLADWRRNVWGGVAFVVCIVIAMYCGIQSVTSGSLSPVAQGFVASATLFCYAEYFAGLEILHEVTKESGELMPGIHPHPLFYGTGFACHHCDVCHSRMKGPHFDAFRCMTCDFDLCLTCYKRKDKPSFKGNFAIRAAGQSSITTWGYFKRCLQFAKRFWWLVATCMISIVAGQCMDLAQPNLQGRMFDGIILFLKGDPEGQIDFQTALKLYLIVNILQGAFNGVKTTTLKIVMNRLTASVRLDLFKGIVRRDIGFFDVIHTGQLTSRLSNDCSNMMNPLQVLMTDLVANSILLIGGAIMSFYTSWRLSMLAITIVPPIRYLYRQWARYGSRVNRTIWQAWADSNAVASESLSNIRTVRAFGTEEYEFERYSFGVGVVLSNSIKQAFVGSSVQIFSMVLNLGTSILIMWYGGYLVMESNGKILSIGKLITFELYWNMMNRTFIAMGNVFNELIRASSSAERVLSLIDSQPEVDPAAGTPIPKESCRGEIVLKKVEFSYHSRPDKKVLKCIDLKIDAGTMTALVGKSGGGKSTIVHLLTRFYEPTAGSIELDGVSMKSLKLNDLRKLIGVVQQETQLFATTVRENLTYGLSPPDGVDVGDPRYPGVSYGRMVEAAKAANAHEFIMELEEGYETRVGEKGIMLSGGQKQRISVARCLLRDPRLIFLDEATSALDAENEHAVQVALDELVSTGQRTIVLIAHRLSTVIDAKQIAVIHEGTVKELGNHEELVKLDGVYATLVKRQLQRDANVLGSDQDNVDKLFESLDEKPDKENSAVQDMTEQSA